MFVPLLKDKIGADKVSQNETELFRHSHDESPHEAVTPEVVCFPECRKDMENILEVAREKRIPVTAFGVGSGLEGQAIPIHKGISVNFERMNRVVDFSPEDMTITVQPRSEEHTSELQSRGHLVCRLLLEKKKQIYN